MERLRVGDEVIVVAGNHKGKKGRIRRIVRDRNAVVIERINIVKRHMKAQGERPGGILEVEAPLSASNVMLIDPDTGKPTRIHYETREGQKVRVAKSGTVIPTPAKD